jgi:orotate phosphoribosyltransferase
MDQNDVYKIFERNGAIKNGHFELASGRHSANYINKDALFARPNEIYTLAKEIAARVKNAGIKPDAIVGFPKGGIIMSQWVAFALSEITGKNILALYAEHDRGSEVFRRGYDELLVGKNVVIAEDIVTSGRTAKQLIEAVKSVQGKVLGVVSLWDRSGNKFLFGNIRHFPLVQIELESWSPFDCPQCKRKVPLDLKLGHAL